MIVKQSISVCLCCILYTALHLHEVKAQNTDLVRIEYTYIPQEQSDNSFDRMRGFINIPIKMNWEGSYLIFGAEFRNTDVEIEDPVNFPIDNLQDFQMYRFSLGYTFKMTPEWRAAFRAGMEIASNFEKRTADKEDFRFSGAAFMIRDRTSDSIAKPNRLILGLQYSTNAGRPFPLPIINYYRKFHPDWSYSLGSPKTNLKYHFGKRQTLQSFVTLDGFFSNIQNDLPLVDEEGNNALADNVSMTLVLGGLGYEFYFTKHILFYFYGGHTFYNEIRLRDDNRNTLVRLNNKNTFYLRSGFKFKL